MQAQLVDDLDVMIDQRSSPEHCVRFVVNRPWLASNHSWVWCVVGGLKKLCRFTKFGGLEKGWHRFLTQMRPASVVLTSVLDSIPFKALQFFRCVKRRLLLFSSESLNEFQELFHVFSTADAML